MKRGLHIVLLLATFVVAGDRRALAVEPVLDVEKAARVKAAYLLNFIRYSQWPEDAFDSPDSPIVLTVAGDCPQAEVLDEVVRRAQPVAGRPVLLQRAPYGIDEADRREFYRSLEQSHLVYVCSLGPESISGMLDRLAGSLALTVGDTPGFVEQGGMIGFVFEQDRILFQADPKAIGRSRVTVSAKVLKLAKIVGEAAPP
jgi:hypothetical protein